MDLQQKKFAHVFKWFDYDRDGYVTPEDIAAMSDKFCLVTEENDQKNRDAITKGWNHWQQLLFGDRDDKKLDKDEFIRFMNTIMIQQEYFDLAIMDIVDGVLGALDRDHNGSLSQEEYVRMYDALGIDPVDSSEAFRRIDRDSSGEISYDELKQAITEFYLSADPDAPGNWLLGPMGSFQ